MQKIYLNKEANNVEQIIREDYDHFENYNNETFGEKFYMVLDLNNEVNEYNFRYNLETKEFEILPEPKRIKVSIIEPSETQVQVAKRLSKIENLLGL